MTDIQTITILARAPTTSFDEAVGLIEQYARVVAAKAVHEATAKAYDDVLATLKTPVPA